MTRDKSYSPSANGFFDYEHRQQTVNLMRFTVTKRYFRDMKKQCAQKEPDLFRGPVTKHTFWVPSIPSVAWQPYPPPLERLRAHSFASPPHDGFAFIEDDY